MLTYIMWYLFIHSFTELTSICETMNVLFLTKSLKEILLSQTFPSITFTLTVVLFQNESFVFSDNNLMNTSTSPAYPIVRFQEVHSTHDMLSHKKAAHSNS